jgi:UTP-glucose-1-phosphate uridylyltransferase
MNAGADCCMHESDFGAKRTSPISSELPAFYGLKFEGRSFDCGSKIGFLTANVAYALERKDIAPEFRAELRGMLGNK